MSEPDSTSDTPKVKSGWIANIGIVLSVVVTAGLGSLVSGSSEDPWYAALTKPPLNPPDIAFGIAWPILFLLMMVSGIMVRNEVGRIEWNGRAFGLFFLQLALNLGWSVLFFFFNRPSWALIGVIALWVSILLMILAFAKVSRAAALLQVPYLAWVTFASYLNLGIVLLN